MDGDVLKETDMQGIPLHNDLPEETSLRHGLMDERAKGQLPATASVLAKAGQDQTLTGEGVYIGEGLPPVPPKLAKRIRSGEFVEMKELLSEICTRGDVEPEAKRRSRHAHDIFTWLQCFGVCASVHGFHSLAMIPELMAYMSTIIRTSREYAGTEWHTYDTLFRKHAALRKESKWSVINPTIYARCFTSAPRNPAKCELCLAVTHDTWDCSHQEPSEDIEMRLRSMEQSIQGLSPSQPVQSSSQERYAGSITKGSATICTASIHMCTAYVEGITRQCDVRGERDQLPKANLQCGASACPTEGNREARRVSPMDYWTL